MSAVKIRLIVVQAEDEKVKGTHVSISQQNEPLDSPDQKICYTQHQTSNTIFYLYIQHLYLTYLCIRHCLESKFVC